MIRASDPRISSANQQAESLSRQLDSNWKPGTSELSTTPSGERVAVRERAIKDPTDPTQTLTVRERVTYKGTQIQRDVFVTNAAGQKLMEKNFKGDNASGLTTITQFDPASGKQTLEQVEESNKNIGGGVIRDSKMTRVFSPPGAMQASHLEESIDHKPSRTVDRTLQPGTKALIKTEVDLKTGYKTETHYRPIKADAKADTTGQTIAAMANGLDSYEVGREQLRQPAHITRTSPPNMSGSVVVTTEHYDAHGKLMGKPTTQTQSSDRSRERPKLATGLPTPPSFGGVRMNARNIG